MHLFAKIVSFFVVVFFSHLFSSGVLVVKNKLSVLLSPVMLLSPFCCQFPPLPQPPASLTLQLKLVTSQLSRLFSSFWSKHMVRWGWGDFYMCLMHCVSLSGDVLHSAWKFELHGCGLWERRCPPLQGWRHPGQVRTLRENWGEEHHRPCQRH